MLKAELEKLVKEQAAEIEELKAKIAELESDVVEVVIDEDTSETGGTERHPPSYYRIGQEV